MYCKKCGYELKNNEDTCPFCGQKVDENVNIFVTKRSNYQQVSKDNYVPYNEKTPIIEKTYEMNNLTWWHHLLIAAGAYVIAELLVYGIILLMIAIFGGKDNMSDEQLSFTSSFAQVISYTITIIIALILGRKHLKDIFSRAKESNTWKWFGIGLGFIYGASIVYSLILQIFNLTSSSENQAELISMTSKNPFLSGLFICLLAPIFEEIVFRFGLFRFLEKINKVLAIVVTTSFFAAAHLIASISAGTFLTDLTSLPSYLIGAFALTFVYYKSKNIVTSIFTHITYNTISFLVILITPYIV